MACLTQGQDSPPNGCTFDWQGSRYSSPQVTKDDDKFPMLLLGEHPPLLKRSSVQAVRARKIVSVIKYVGHRLGDPCIQLVLQKIGYVTVVRLQDIVIFFSFNLCSVRRLPVNYIVVDRHY